jgi:hypothetical protein
MNNKVKILCVISSFIFLLGASNIKYAMLPEKEIKELYEKSEYFKGVNNVPDFSRIVEINDIKCVKTGQVISHYLQQNYECSTKLVLSNGYIYKDTLYLYKNEKSKLVVSKSFYKMDLISAIKQYYAAQALKELREEIENNEN